MTMIPRVLESSSNEDRNVNGKSEKQWNNNFDYVAVIFRKQKQILKGSILRRRWTAENRNCLAFV